MTTFELWQTVLTAIGGTAALVAVLGWLATTVVKSMLDRDSQRFVSELQATGQREIERFKSTLETLNYQQRFRFERLHARRAEVIAELHALLVEALWSAEDFVSPIEWAGDEPKATKYQHARNKLVDLYRFVQKNRIYLPDSVCADLDQINTEVRSHVIQFGAFVQIPDDALLDNTRRQKDEAWGNSWKALQELIPPARKKLEAAFRQLLGDEPSVPETPSGSP